MTAWEDDASRPGDASPTSIQAQAATPRVRLRQRPLRRLRQQRPRATSCSRTPPPAPPRSGPRTRRRGDGRRTARHAAGRLPYRRHRQLQQHARRRHPAAQLRPTRWRLGDERHRGQQFPGAGLDLVGLPQFGQWATSPATARPTCCSATSPPARSRPGRSPTTRSDRRRPRCSARRRRSIRSSRSPTSPATIRPTSCSAT